MKKFVNIQLPKRNIATVILSVILITGLSTAIVRASIPDNNGVIHGCYSNRDGTLRVIDTDAGGTCTAGKEAALNWNQAGPSGAGSVNLRDSNNQILGSIIDNGNFSQGAILVYNSNINKLVNVEYNSSTNQADFGTSVGAVFQSTDCTGQAYVNPPKTTETTLLLRWGVGGNWTYGILDGNETPQSITVNSNLSGDGQCSTYSYPATVVPLTVVPAPYATITLPFKL